MQRIAEIRGDYMTRIRTSWRGHERVLMLELVRALDQAAFAFKMAPNRNELLKHDEFRHAILRGAAFALRPLLESLGDDPNPVPWGPTTPNLSTIADQHLGNCGYLAGLERLVALERHGLAETTFTSEDHLIVEVASADDELAELEAGAWLSNLARTRLAAAESRMAAIKHEVAIKIDSYTSVDRGWFLKYDPDWEMIEYYRNYAAILAAGTAEGRALPAGALLGGRSFENWTDTSLKSLGRMLHHIACATRMKATTPHLEMRNLLTVFARKDDVSAIWQEGGETKEWANRIIAGLTLDSEAAVAAERDYEIPVPYYIDFGRHFVLLPIFGGLLNAHAGLVSHLRRVYRTDWDRAVGTRETVFRNDLQELFSPPRYLIAERGMRLRRPNGSELTDLDAIVLDHQTGKLLLIQLKWPDIYGRSLSERNSRRINLLKANEWVSRVNEWIGVRSSRDVAAELGLRAAGPEPPTMLVIARHAVRFSGEKGYDDRAYWISWPDLMQMKSKNPETDLLQLICEETTRRRQASPIIAKSPSIYHLKTLTVEVRVS